MALVENVTVRAVAVAAVMIPTAPLLNAIVLSSTVVLKPKPLTMMLVVLTLMLSVLLVIAGLTVATCTASPLLTPFVDTTPINMSALAGNVEKVTINMVAVEAVTIPTAPLLRTTTLFPGVASKPNPLIVNSVAVAVKSAVLLVTTGEKSAT